WSMPCASAATLDSTGTYGSGSHFPVGTNTVHYVVDDGDGHVAQCEVDVTVLPAPTPTFSYGVASLCRNAATIMPTGVSPAGGTFSSTSGLSINATTGAIDPTTSVASAYSVTYTIGGACGSSIAHAISIIAAPNAGVDATFSLCTNAGNTDLFPHLGGS